MLFFVARGELLLCHLHYEKAASRIAEQNGTVLQAFDIFAPLSGWLPLLGKQRRRQTEPRFAAPAHDERPTAPCR